MSRPEATPEAQLLRSDALQELLEELSLLDPSTGHSDAWNTVWATVEVLRTQRRRLDAIALEDAQAKAERERREAIRANPTRCWCPDRTPRTPTGTWAPAPDCPIHNGPCECGAPRRQDGSLSCAR